MAMFPLTSLPESQAALALAIIFASFVYEDGATLLAATLSVSGRLEPPIGLLAAFLGIWIGDIGLYGMGAAFGQRTMRSRRLQKYLRPEALAKAASWFSKHGSLALVMSRAIPGSRLPLYVAAGALRLPIRMFARITGICSAVWVSAIFAIWRFSPAASSGYQKFVPWLLTAVVLFAPWLLSKSSKSGAGPFGKRERALGQGATGLCAP